MSEHWVQWRRLECDSGHFWVEPYEQSGRLSTGRRCPVCQAAPVVERSVYVAIKS